MINDSRTEDWRFGVLQPQTIRFIIRDLYFRCSRLEPRACSVGNDKVSIQWQASLADQSAGKLRTRSLKLNMDMT